VDPSPATLTLFYVTVTAVTLALVMALRRAGVSASLGLLLGVVYVGVPAGLAGAGLLDRYNPLPAPALLLVLGITVLTVALTLTRLGGLVANAIPLAAVVALQAFRVAVELWLHRLYLEGVVPVQMTYAGRNFDIVSGVTGLLLGAWLLAGRPAPRGLVLAWNLLSLALLANIVTIAILATPVPFRQFFDGPPNLLPSTFPYVWLPSLLVQVALASHLIVFRQLRARPTRRAGDSIAARPRV
jgi:hypothetical protein